MEASKSASGAGDAQAVRWVELLLEPAISEERLVEAASHLCQCHYQDVVEERNIEGLCGYPCCERQLGVVPQQKYHISVQRKLVLDLTERKKFCRAECYKASKYYARQLSTLSPWSREHRHGLIKLLPLTDMDSAPHPSSSHPTQSLYTSQLQESGHTVSTAALENAQPSTPPLESHSPSTPSLDPSPSAPLLEPSSPTAPLLEPSSPTAPLLEPSSPTAPLLEPSSPSAPLLEPSSPTAPLLEPSSPSASLLEPSSPTAPLLEPSSPSAPLLELSSPTAPLLEPSSPSASLLELSSPTAPLLEPSSPSAPLLELSSPSAPLLEPSSPSASLLEPSSPTAPLLEPSSPSAPLLELSSPTATLLEPSSPTAPLLEPSSPSATLLEPSSPTAPLLEPSSPSATLLEPSSPTAPLLEPSSSSAPLLEPSSPTAPLLEPSSPSIPPPQEIEQGLASLELVEERGQLPKWSPVGKILHALNSWCTPTTLKLLQSGDEVKCDATQGAVYLPPVHSVAQNQLQKSIFWQQARKNLADVAGELGMRVSEAQSSLAALLKTFKLDRHTVIFRPAEWRLILFVLLKRLYPNCTSPQPLVAWLTAVGASLDDLKLMSATLESPKINFQSTAGAK